ncbi:phosphocholine-specific phospholipase C [Haloferula sargassicola]|uniref:phospholipase C n=1 Tax=Haloferula sargassicola TaxID=490096 RepID=A0ABP9UMY6_9BACT
MSTRRSFLKQASLLSGGLGLLPPSLLRAMNIEPTGGSTFLDAEHVVILMQENRSFDHTFGTLRGVRGFDDPRIISLPGGHPVWLQSDAEGRPHAPSRLNIRDTNSTWLSCLPHDRHSQVAASNDGRHDQWLRVKQSGHRELAALPLTLGYYQREDLSFYYQFADAFTVCDHYFCSASTCTSPNRLYHWTGTARDPRDPASPPRLDNSQIDYDSPLDWPTFPERLEDLGVSWRVYQNEVWIETGLDGDDLAWLGNFGDNPLEYFSQYQLRFHPRRMQWVRERIVALEKLAADDAASAGDGFSAGLAQELADLIAERERFTPEAFAALPDRQRALFEKAFTRNTGDPHHRETVTLRYHDGSAERQVKVPAGDVLHQFRQDARNGQLPTVSWLAAPENFSDHPSAPWYGSWYVSEVLDILTQDPELWKKTILILNYDENDGYFDHMPPFVPPHTGQPGTGAASAGLDTTAEFDEHGHPIGLGYRVPMVIASPWTRGGKVCSQVFDHTSVLRFLEVFLSHKTGAPVREEHISDWRRTICGDLTSAFASGPSSPLDPPQPLQRDAVVESIHRARFMDLPGNFRTFTDQQLAEVLKHPTTSPLLARQENGSRLSCALPYELEAGFQHDAAGGTLDLTLTVGNRLYGTQAAGAPFHVYAPGYYRTSEVDAAGPLPYEQMRRWSFAVKAGDRLKYTWPLSSFDRHHYHLQLYGPNGFHRECRGTAGDPSIVVRLLAQADPQPDGNALLEAVNTGPAAARLIIEDRSYGAPAIRRTLAPGATLRLPLLLHASHRWYDFAVTLEGNEVFLRRFAGRIETGEIGPQDPAIGRAST